MADDIARMENDGKTAQSAHFFVKARELMTPHDVRGRWWLGYGTMFAMKSNTMAVASALAKSRNAA